MCPPFFFCGFIIAHIFAPFRDDITKIGAVFEILPLFWLTFPANAKKMKKPLRKIENYAILIAYHRTDRSEKNFSEFFRGAVTFWEKICIISEGTRNGIQRLL